MSKNNDDDDDDDDETRGTLSMPTAVLHFKQYKTVVIFKVNHILNYQHLCDEKE